MINLKTHYNSEIENRFVKALASRADTYSDDTKKELWSIIVQLDGITGDYNPQVSVGEQIWFKSFILANYNLLKVWTENNSTILKSSEVFKNIYTSFFCNGSKKYLDIEKTYNAYDFLLDLDVQVCPYCQDEFIDVKKDDTKSDDYRTTELDHFYPKKMYPMLAMCFYNLIPSGHNCNHLKLEEEIGTSPYDESIEKQTYLFPDIPVGVNIESIGPDECLVNFHAKNGMQKNVNVMKLESRYAHTKNDVYEIIKNRQQFNEKMFEALTPEQRQSIMKSLFKIPSPEAEETTLHLKLIKDLNNYLTDNY